MAIVPFSIPFSQTAVDDLRERLARTRWPDKIPGSGWEYGFDLESLNTICEYWRTGFDWKAQVARVAQLEHFRYTADGIGIHFVHARGKGPSPIPLILTHGWPGSFLEMLGLLPLLTDPAAHGADAGDSFDVVIPSLPGFGYSDRPAEPGMNVFRIAELWAGLMDELGYSRFGAQGGDLGAGVSTVLGLRHSERVLGIHLNYIPGSYRPYVEPGARLAAVEEQFLKDAARWYDEEGAYAHLQRTEPLTAAYGLNDSPAGLAAWILDKFRKWADCGGELERRFTPDELLANVTLYWMTGTIHSSFRIYFEGRKAPLQFAEGDFVSVPCGIARFPKEEPFPPRPWIERGYSVQQWTEMPRGGHFAALEEPALLAEDIRRFFRRFR
ncbi:MAG TPA: epoxide hydrolase [Silvibacterium sp.]|nr:epoxide hydrolase [Silvibacterium sp.]